MRIGLYGGSFDPVHNGHLAVAKACRDSAGLDGVWFVPTAVQPFKPHGPVASDHHRVAMLRLAGATVCTVEIDRGGVSYTVDTLRQLTADHTDNEWFLLMGADTLRELPTWREPAAILEMAAPLAVHRPGEPAPDFSSFTPLVSGERLNEIADGRVEMTPVDASSSEVRTRVADRLPIDLFCSPPVAAYIAEHKLYQE